ncbi:hypothetical protein Tco_0716447 [Tanacetum coccineum]
MKSYLDTLERLGYPMPNEFGVSLILNSLNKDYDQFVQNYNMHSMGKTLAELHAMLKLHEKGIPKKAETPIVLAIREGKIQKDKKKPQGAKGKNKLVYAPKAKITPPPKRDNLEKDSICHHCKEVGHWRRNYQSYHAELKKRKNASLASTSGYPKEMIESSGSHGLLEISGSDKGLELIQEEDTQPSENTSKAHNKVAPIVVEPQNFGVPIRRSARIPQVPDRCGYYVDIEEYELGDFNEPPNYKAALADPESNKWLKAMNTEMQSMRDNQVWYLVDLPFNGEATYILGIKIIRDRSKRLISLSQSAYLEKILKKFRMENSKKGYTSMMEKPDYRKSQGAKTPNEVQRMQRVPYASAIHWIAVKTILKYLRNTKDMVLVYGEKPEDEMKVSSVDWKSAKQSTNAMSSVEVKYIATGEASMEEVWMRKFIDGLGDVMPSNKRPMEMLCDNEHALVIASDPGILKGARHFQRTYHYIREVIQEGEIILKKVHTDDNVADSFTKPMSFNKHFKHAMAIGIVLASSLM